MQRCLAAFVAFPLLALPAHAHATSHCARVRACPQVEGKSHTSFLLEGPMAGGRDVLMDLVVPLLFPHGPASPGGAAEAGGRAAPRAASAQQWRRQPPQSYPALCPTVLCNLASLVCPF